MFYFDAATWAHAFLLALEYMYLKPGQQTDTIHNTRAFDIARSNLEMVRKEIDDKDAFQVEKELGQLSHFKSNVLMKHIPNIPKEKVSESLEKYRESLTEKDRKNIIENIYNTGEGFEKIAQWDFQADGSTHSKIHYGLVAHSNSPDRTHVDLLIAVYDVDFKMKSNVLVMKDVKKLKNFFRYMALNDFKSEGLIDINI